MERQLTESYSSCLPCGDSIEPPSALAIGGTVTDGGCGAPFRPAASSGRAGATTEETGSVAFCALPRPFATAGCASLVASSEASVGIKILIAWPSVRPRSDDRDGEEGQLEIGLLAIRFAEAGTWACSNAKTKLSSQVRLNLAINSSVVSPEICLDGDLEFFLTLSPPPVRFPPTF